MNQSSRIYRCPRDHHYPLQKYEACPKCHLWPMVPTWSLAFIWLVMLSITGLLTGCGLLRNNETGFLPARPTETQVFQSQTEPANATPPTISPSGTFTLAPTQIIPPICSKDGFSIKSPIDGMIQVCVTRGNFQMGSDPEIDKNAVSDELPLHTVMVKAFWIDKTEVTNQQYALCVQAGLCSAPVSEELTDPIFFGNSTYDNYPVTYVDWNQAKAYCQWANRRLPTEAEWEKAARGPKGLVYPWGNNPPTSDLLNYKLQKDGITPVGSYPEGKSYYGAVDISGNVMEWVWDLYQNDYYQSQTDWVDPVGPTASDYGITKGGAWISHGDYRVRSAARYGYKRSTRLGANGFRCAVDAPQP